MRRISLSLLPAVVLLALAAPRPASAQTDVLMVQTSAPWDTTSNEDVMNGLGLTYDLVTDWNLVDWASLGDYRVMLVVNDQAQGFYDGHAAHVQQLEDFVSNGGDLLFFAAGAGWAGGQLTAPLPGGLPWHFDPAWTGSYAHYNVIVDPYHPIVTSELSDNIPLTDAVMDGNYCSHGWFESDELLNETRVIFRQSDDEGGQPTTIDYRVGLGHVVASTNTWEFHYAGLGYQSSYHGDFAIQNLDDVYLYMLAVGGVTSPDAVIYQHYIHTAPDCFDGEVPAGTQIVVGTDVSNLAAVPIDDMSVLFYSEDEDGNRHDIGFEHGLSVAADGQTQATATWDTTGVPPGTYLVMAQAIVHTPEELLELQDNNASGRDCAITIGDDDDDDATPPYDDDDAADDDAADDDDDAAGDEFPDGLGCTCDDARGAITSRGSLLAFALLGMFAAGRALRRR